MCSIPDTVHVDTSCGDLRKGPRAHDNVSLVAEELARIGNAPRLKRRTSDEVARNKHALIHEPTLGEVLGVEDSDGEPDVFAPSANMDVDIHFDAARTQCHAEPPEKKKVLGCKRKDQARESKDAAERAPKRRPKPMAGGGEWMGGRETGEERERKQDTSEYMDRASKQYASFRRSPRFGHLIQILKR